MTTPTDVARNDQWPGLSNMVSDLQQLTAGDTGEDNSAFVMDVMDAIINAESFDDIFAAQETSMLSGKDFVGVPFWIERPEDIQWRKSSDANVQQGGFPFYAIISLIKLENGEPLTINCGGKTFVAVLYSLQQKGYFSGEEQMPLVIRSVASPNGAYLQLVPYKVVSLPAKGVSGGKSK